MQTQAAHNTAAQFVSCQLDGHMFPEIRSLLYAGVAIWCRYARLADWQYIGSCAQAAPDLPLVGNGDVLSWTDYEAHMKAAPELSTCMIAR